MFRVHACSKNNSINTTFLFASPPTVPAKLEIMFPSLPLVSPALRCSENAPRPFPLLSEQSIITRPQTEDAAAAVAPKNVGVSKSANVSRRSCATARRVSAAVESPLASGEEGTP